MEALAWVQPFLRHVANGSTLSEAAAAASISSGAVAALRKRNADFDEALKQALEDSTDILESTARRRAITGVAKPVIYQGRLVYRTERYVDDDGKQQDREVLDEDGQPVPLLVHEPSDALLALLLKGRRKEFSTERTELTGPNGTPVAIDSTTRAARIAALLETAKSRGEIV